MIRNILLFLFFGFVLTFIAIWAINGGITRTKANVLSAPDPLTYLFGMSSSSDSFFTLPGQAAAVPATPSVDFGSGSDTSSDTSGNLSPADAQAKLDELQNKYNELQAEYETSGPGYTHPQ